MRMRILLAAAIGLIAAPHVANAADSVGGKNEKPMEITGKVVDILCELTKRCAPDCGGGRRQLGLLQGDGKLVPVVKNADLFGGAQADLAPLCGRIVTLDGLLFENPQMPVFMAQGVKADPAAKDFTPAEAFIKQWIAKNGPTDEWFRADPLVKEQISRNGVLGVPGLQPKPQ
jgi:hypothetical protein